MLLHAAHAADHGAPVVDCGHVVSGQWFGSRCQIDTQLIFHTGIQHSTRYTYTPVPLDEDLDKKYAVPFVMPLVGAALLVHSFLRGKVSRFKLIKKMNHSKAVKHYGRHWKRVFRQEVLLQEKRT